MAKRTKLNAETSLEEDLFRGSSTRIVDTSLGSESEEVEEKSSGQSEPQDEVQDVTRYLSKLEEENRVLNMTLHRLEEETSLLRALFNKTHGELENFKKPALLVAEIVNVFEDKAVIKLSNGNKFYSYISSGLEVDKGDAVLVEQKSLNIVQKVDISNGGFEVEKYLIVEKPNETWKEVGGLKEVIAELKEVIELPLKKPKLFEKVGITPPKGVLLYGPPGTGKTLLAKAVAHSTDATFIEIVGSELVQKFIGEGSKLVKELFALARRKAPAIIFIDELDALAAMRTETGTSGEREVNRTFMQLLAELDGFEPLGNIKVIAATNRKDILDHAIVRPGRLDRLIEVGLPDAKGRSEILKVHTSRMNLQKVDLKKVVEITDGFSGAELKAVCTEAGYFAIRKKRDHVVQEDFVLAVEKVFRSDEDDDEEMIAG